MPSKDPSSVPSTHIRWLTNNLKLQPQGVQSPLLLLRVCACVHAHTRAHIHILTIILVVVGFYVAQADLQLSILLPWPP